jgi:hypothetical protein
MVELTKVAEKVPSIAEKLENLSLSLPIKSIIGSSIPSVV